MKMFKKRLVGFLGLSLVGVMSYLGVAEANGITVSLPAVTENTGATGIVVPVNVSEARGIAGFTLRVTFNPAVIQATAAGVGALNPGWTFLVPPTIDNTAGEITLAPLAMPLVGLPAGSGSIAKLTFNVVGNPGASTPLTIAEHAFSDALGVMITSTATHGKFTVALPPPVPVLRVIPTTLNFGPVDTQKTFDITNIGTGALTWSIAEEVAWLTVSPLSGSTTIAPDLDTITVTVDRTGLPIGIHQGVISVTSDGGSATVAVSIEAPGVPVLKVTPTLLDFGAGEAKKTFTIANTGTGILRWEIGIPNIPNIADWLAIYPHDGTTTTETDTVTVTVSRRKVAAGPYSADILVEPKGLPHQIVRVTMSVPEPPKVKPIVLGFADGDIRKMMEAVAEVYLINPGTKLPPTLVVTDFAALGIGEGYRAEWLIWEVEAGLALAVEDEYKDLILQVPAENALLWGQTEHLKSLPLPHGILEAYDGQTYKARLEIVNSAIQTVAISDILSFRTVTDEYTDDIDKDGVPDEQRWGEFVDEDGDGIDDRDPADIDIKTILNIISKQKTFIRIVDHQYPADTPRVAKAGTLDAYGLASPLGYLFADGVYIFRIEGLTPGSWVNVELLLSEPFRKGDIWWKYDTIRGWLPYATAGGEGAERIIDIDGVETKRVIIRFVDGGFGDTDGVINGVIVDPSGPGRAKPPVVDPVADVDRLCFIATAAFGTPLAEEVGVLRRLRDEHLLTNRLGQRFVALYYRHSPSLAGFISEREWAKRTVQIALLPIVKVAEFIVGEK